jgi:hypothetical protein
METKIVFALTVGPLISVAALSPIVLYIVARWRAHREPIADPQLGIKFVLHYFSIIAFHLALAGATLLIYTMIKPGGGSETMDSESKSESYRMAFGFLLPAGMVLAAHLAMIRRTNDVQFPGVKRLFYGFNLLITGLAGFAALVIGFQALLFKGSTHGMAHFGGAAILVYCTAWGLLAWRFDQLVIGSSGFSAVGGGSIVMPQAPPPPPPAAAAGGGLPSLGGGSFPPLEPPK